MPSLEAALVFATRAHKGQRDKQNQEYILHPIRVMLSVPEYLRIPALFHDLVEDTPFSLQDLIWFGYSERDVELIKLLTKQKDESRKDYIDRIMTDPDAILIKRADMRDNIDRIATLDSLADRERLEKKYRRDITQMGGSESV